MSPISHIKVFLQAAVVCQELGYNGFINFTLASAFGPVPSQFAFDNVNCSGRETSLNDCYYLNMDDCTSFEGAGVFCNTEPSDGKFVHRCHHPASSIIPVLHTLT